MDSVSVEIFSVAFHSGVSLGCTLVEGLAVIVVLVTSAKFIRSM